VQVVIIRRQLWPEVQRICRKYILLVIDEVICGFGRLGAWFGSDYYGLAPDLMPMAKGMSSGYLPIGGVMVSDRVASTLAEGGEFYHGFTYSGHPTCAAVAIRAIEILRDLRSSVATTSRRILRCAGERSIIDRRRTRTRGSSARWAGRDADERDSRVGRRDRARSCRPWRRMRCQRRSSRRSSSPGAIDELVEDRRT
jgi:adenosylmethionine-8-amino-7-oxononanoate aminotransferase